VKTRTFATDPVSVSDAARHRSAARRCAYAEEDERAREGSANAAAEDAARVAMSRREE
jgi:hypothetical protein